MDSIQKQIRAYERGVIGNTELVELVKLVEQEADEEEEEELEQEILNES